MRYNSKEMEDLTISKTHTHTHTHFLENDFLHVLRVVQSESALISNTIFFPFAYGTWK